ncbi:MAG: SpoIID/LytB domain-containing protein, partial [Mycobacteriales bacterium]
PAAVGGATVTQWRVVSVNGVQSLEGLWSATWQPYPPTGAWATTTAMGFHAASGVASVLRTDGTVRDYRGDVVLQSAGGLRAVDRVPLESYLRSVTPSESPSSWPAAALQAQAVAARTYTVHAMSSSRAYDICDTTACQVYSGLAAYTIGGAQTRSYEAASTDAAVAATAGQIRTYDGQPILAQYSSSNGGWSTDGGEPYLVAAPDPYDGVVPNSAHSWTATVSAATLGAHVGVGVAQLITVNGRDGHGDWGGRTTSVTVSGTTGTVTLTGADLRGRVGLKSEWWTLPAGSPPNRQLQAVDLYAVQANGSGSGVVDVHALSAASGYQTFLQHRSTALGPVSTADWTFLVAPYGNDGQPDLYAIRLRGGASGMVEVHVLSAASNYHTFLTHFASGMPALAPASGSVALGQFGQDGAEDLFVVLDANTGSGNVEVHVLSAADHFHTFLAHRATVLSETGAATEWQFLVGDGAGNGDLVAVHESGSTGSGKTEVHVISAADAYHSYARHAATALPLGSGATFALGDPQHIGAADLYVLLPHGASGRTELHVLSALSGYTQYTAHVATALPPTPSGQWEDTLG